MTRRAVTAAVAANTRHDQRAGKGDPGLRRLAAADRRSAEALPSAADIDAVGRMYTGTLLRLREWAGSKPVPREPGASNPTGSTRPEPPPQTHPDDGWSDTYSDPTSDQALTRDDATHAANQLRARARELTRATERLIEELIRLAPVGQPPPVRPLEQSARRMPCASCARHHVVDGVPWECWADVVTGDVGGRLTTPMPLCRSCRWAVQSSAPGRSHKGRLPGRKTLAAHHDREHLKYGAKEEIA